VRFIDHEQRDLLLLQYFAEADETPEPCGTCDNCQRTEQFEASIPAPAEAAPPPPAPQPAPLFAVGSRVRVPRHEEGEVIAIAGDMVTITFGEGIENKTFLASYVQPSDTAVNLTKGPA
jgi:ATP-dependent DNA helicase RecQ